MCLFQIAKEERLKKIHLDLSIDGIKLFGKTIASFEMASTRFHKLLCR